MCTRGSREFAPSKLSPAPEAQLSISECHAIGAGRKLVTNKLGPLEFYVSYSIINLKQASVLTELTHSKSYLMGDK